MFSRDNIVLAGPIRACYSASMESGRETLTEHEAIEHYVRERLSSECRQRGAMTQIAKRTGLRVPTVHNICRGQRGVGEATARVLAEYWGITYAELERLALGIPLRKDQDPLPNLTATLDWCRTEYPREFLTVYTKMARKATRDKRRAEWLADIDAQLRVWAGGGPISPLGIHDESMPEPAQAEARIKRMRRQAG